MFQIHPIVRIDSTLLQQCASKHAPKAKRPSLNMNTNVCQHCFNSAPVHSKTHSRVPPHMIHTCTTCAHDLAHLFKISEHRTTAGARCKVLDQRWSIGAARLEPLLEDTCLGNSLEHWNVVDSCLNMLEVLWEQCFETRLENLGRRWQLFLSPVCFVRLPY